MFSSVKWGIGLDQGFPNLAAEENHLKSYFKNSDSWVSTTQLWFWGWGLMIFPIVSQGTPLTLLWNLEMMETETVCMVTAGLSESKEAFPFHLNTKIHDERFTPIGLNLCQLLKYNYLWIIFGLVFPSHFYLSLNYSNRCLLEGKCRGSRGGDMYFEKLSLHL